MTEQPDTTTQDEAAAEQAAAPPAPPEDGSEAVEQDLEELREKAAKADEFLAIAQRTQADFENFRKRAQRERGEAEARGVAKLARELLPAIDSLERALQAAEPRSEDAVEDHLAAGIRLVHAEISGALARLGVSRYGEAGERFDPAVHEAMAQAPAPDTEPGTVVEVYQAGYALDGAVIRPARVVVAA